MRLYACALLFGLLLAGCVVADNNPPPRRPVAVDPVCGTTVDMSTPWRGRFRGQEYYFHSDYCRETFYYDPEAYVGAPYARGPHPHPPPGGQVAVYVDPVCGRNVPASTRWRGQYQGHPYYFHSDQCLSQFTAHPQPYVSRYRNPPPRRYYVD
jgi:Cu+-exporting ATPase